MKVQIYGISEQEPKMASNLNNYSDVLKQQGIQL